MSLLTSSIVVSVAIAGFAMVPWFFQFARARKISRTAMFLGAFVLVGVCFFDLIPEMFEIGGGTSIVIMAASLALFWGIHALGGKHEGHDHGEEGFLLGAMALHCFAGGMLLVSTFQLSERLAQHVFWGLILHKGFEAIAVSSIFFEKIESRVKVFVYIVLYAISFPAGALLTAWFSRGMNAAMIENVAMIITSIAVGNLMVCLWHDVGMPVIRYYRLR